MSRTLITGLALLAAVVLQVSVAPQLAVFGVVPNFVFLVVVTLALLEGPVTGCVAGFIGGLLFDLLGASVVGPYALVFCVAGYTAGLMNAHMFAEGWLLPVSVVFIASVGAEITYGIIMAVLDIGLPFWSALVRIMLPGAVYNTVLAVLLYPLMTRLLRRDRTVKSFRRLA
ncbi:MAG: rod shape-determining protein MreD [Coriobacteriia bacterium]|nr:rod shape-determining protein MreD [Coriobacteriia bacterium]